MRLGPGDRLTPPTPGTRRQSTMAAHVLDTCPNCGKRIGLPLTGCTTLVGESLIANSGGKCPDCGADLVDDHPLRDVGSFDLLAAAKNEGEKLDVNVVDLPLPIRLRLLIIKMNVGTLGGLLDLPRDLVRDELSDHVSYFSQIEEMLDGYGLSWRAGPEE